MAPDVTLLAPGGDISNGGGVVSSVLGDAYQAFQGTSMATPHVAGAIAALRAKFPSLKLSAIEAALHRTGTSVPDLREANVGLTQRRIRVDAARLLLSVPKAPSNDNFASARTVTSTPIPYVTDNLFATRQSGEPKPSGATGPTIWFKWVAPATQTVTFSTWGSHIDTVIGVYTGTSVSALTVVAVNDNANVSTKASQVSVNATSGRTYWVQAAGKTSSQTGIIKLRVHAPPSNDKFSKARTLTVSNAAPTVALGRNAFATLETGEPTTHFSRSVWWKFKAPATGTYVIDTLGSTSVYGLAYDTRLGVYTGTAVNALTQVAFNDDVRFSQNRNSRVSFRATSGKTYYIAVGAAIGVTAEFVNRGNLRLTITPPGATVPQRVAASAN